VTNSNCRIICLLGALKLHNPPQWSQAPVRDSFSSKHTFCLHHVTGSLDK